MAKRDKEAANGFAGHIEVVRTLRCRVALPGGSTLLAADPGQQG
jgi:hypothetical protein